VEQVWNSYDFKLKRLKLAHTCAVSCSCPRHSTLSSIRLVTSISCQCTSPNFPSLCRMILGYGELGFVGRVVGFVSVIYVILRVTRSFSRARRVIACGAIVNSL
jgi:hypothetical protein